MGGRFLQGIVAVFYCCCFCTNIATVASTYSRTHLSSLLAKAGQDASLLLDQRRSCSSLDGPYCPGINGLSNSRVIHDKTKLSLHPGEKSFLFQGSDYSEVFQTIVDQLANLVKAEVVGSYDIYGTLTDEGVVEMQPGQWIQKPSGQWSEVGLVGVYQSPKRMTLTIVDTNGKAVESCTGVDLTVAEFKDDEDISNTFGYLLEGTWTGSYNCFDVETELKLTILESEQKDSSGKTIPFEGVYEFKVASDSSFLEEDIELVTINGDGEEIDSGNLQSFLQHMVDQAVHTIKQMESDDDMDSRNEDQEGEEDAEEEDFEDNEL
mmetsp:Transcript_10288/g.13509  ORF Transcript_10288/g.13509 Transcript_10288/m.13509 type:complete len:321 (+) Transcript_10288:159-1121(+)